MSQWNTETQPQWKHLLKKTAGDIKNVYQTSRGWVHKWPWGEEVIVAIGGLLALGAEPTVSELRFLSPLHLPNTTNQTLKLLVKFNEPVTVNTDAGVPTISLNSSNAAQANIALSYNVAASSLATGEVVFLNAAVDGSSYEITENLTANSATTRTNWGSILDTVNTSVTAANAFTGLAVTIPVKQHVPIQSATVSANATYNKADVTTLKFNIKFNQAVTVNGAALPTVRAISNVAAIANVTLTYVPSLSNPAVGNLVFESATVNSAILVSNVTYTVNSTSTLTNFASIRNEINGTPANAIAVANTIDIVVAA